MRYSLFSYCCSTDLQGHPRSMIFVIWKPICDFLYKVINSDLNPVSHRFWDTATYILKLFIKTATKPLQMETAYRKFPAPYPMVSSLIPYDLPPYLRNCARWTHGHYGPPMGTRPPRVEWSRDRWCHVTPKGQSRARIIFEAPYLYNGAR